MCDSETHLGYCELVYNRHRVEQHLYRVRHNASFLRDSKDICP